MGTGSSEWIGIKTDFEKLNEVITELIFAFDQGKVVSRNQLENVRINANNFKTIAFEYDPKNYDESQEQDLLLEKVNDGLAIYTWLADRIA
jgi:hypothetical protein